MPGQASVENGKLGGRPPGSKSAATLAREAVARAVNQRIMESADVILNAQLSIARGQHFLYKIQKTKVIGPKGGVSYKNERPELVTDQFEIEDYLNDQVDIANGDMEDENDPAATYYYMTTKEPNNMAIDSMFNRALGKATDSLDITTKGDKVSGSLTAEVLATAEELLKQKKINQDTNE